MIEGINPFTISSIGYTKFTRIGCHPSYSKIMKKKHPIASFFGLYGQQLFDGVYRACVIIRGPDGTTLKVINCKSNAAALNLRDELNRQLKEFVDNAKIKS